MAKPSCVECEKPTVRQHPILGTALCSKCQRDNQDKYRYVTKTTALKDYRLKLSDLSDLGVHKVDNPHYKKAAPMQLYLLSQVQQLAKVKWGSSEPYLVALSQFDEKLLQWFLEDMERLKQLTPEKFQYLIANRLEGLGLSVQVVGDVYRKDGGVDIIAFPKSPTLPFLLAVQVKHHRADRKTNVSDVKDLHSVMTSNLPFHVGMLVTNTRFTADAQWFYENNKKLLRLRDSFALRRWLQNDFINEHEWQEIPEEIELAPGVLISIPKQTLLQNK